MRFSRSAAVARWLAPSVIGAGLGAVIAGLVEGLSSGFGPVGAPASAGYAALFAIPLCLAGSLVVRGLWAAWRPHRLAPALVEDGGGAPRLAAWLVFLAVSAFLLSWACFNATHLLAKHTTFKVNVVALTLPIVVLGFAAALTAASRPAVDVIAAGLRAVDRRLARRLGRSLLAPRALLGAAIAIACTLVLVAWYVTLKPRLGNLDGGIFVHPVIAAAVTAAAHPVWRRLAVRVRRLALVAPALVGVLGCAGTAVWVRAERPALLLAIWAQPTVAGLVIETVFDVETLRSKAMIDQYRPVLKPGATPRSVVLITIDTVRADHTPIGGGHAVMPTLAALGRHGVVFDHAIAPSNTTRRSLPALILGESPPRVHGRVVGWALKLDPRHVPLGERLWAAGYATAGFFCCASFWQKSKKTGYSRGLDEVSIDPDGETLGEEARQWVVDHFADPAAPPAFVWLHFFEPHNWQRQKGKDDPTSPGNPRSRKYDRALAEVDADLAGLIAAIDAIPAARRPIVVLTSDHGEGLGDHGALNHSSDLYQSQTHVPWVIAVPGVAPRRIAQPVSGTDLTPTILDLAGFVPPGMPDMDGVSLADLVTGARADDPEGGYAFSAMIQDRSTPSNGRAITRGRWKLVEHDDDALELYDVRADPDELRDVAADHPDVVADLHDLLDARHAIDGKSPF